ncbi:phage regulatory CII family protein [Chromobacterium violaceum]|nr:phage regulatory CII family protein [Chromobacterium violaceum]
MSRYSHITATAQAVAKSYHNGIAGLAVAMQKNPVILANKLNPNAEQNQLSLEEAAEITDRTQDPAIADALAALCNRITVALPSGELTLKELSRAFCQLAAECGDVGQEINAAEQPESEWGERISPSEARRIERALWDLLSVGAGLLQRVRG